MATSKSEVSAAGGRTVRGEFVTLAGERFYAIRNVDRMAPFFMTVISNVDHWLFLSSNGGLTAGRVSPDTALLPYVTVDKIHDSPLHTGSRTLLRVDGGGRRRHWEPFNREQDWRYRVSRNLYKNLLGNKVCFEEINHDLQLVFRYCWLTSESHGFVRKCELLNLRSNPARVELLDGLQNVLPAGTPRFSQTNASNLVDAYKWTELDEDSGLACFTLYSGITDRAEPCESLKANTVFCLGLEAPKVLLSSAQLDDFRGDQELQRETWKRGIRGAFFVNATLELPPRDTRQWTLVADVEQSQADVAGLRRQLQEPGKLSVALARSIAAGSDELARIMASADSFQATAEEAVAGHHYANVLFNVLRGGVFDDQYNVITADLLSSIRHFNRAVFERNRGFLDSLPAEVDFHGLLLQCRQQQDPQLERLCYEYLPITFARRHGDPSRPWNHFAIRLRDDAGRRLLSYQGNWRDIFQNWEALAFSFPEFIENIIARFVNASTMDGYNPYRITKDGIDWEVEDPHDPWSYIGYWGDHQVIYLQKLLELSAAFHPSRLNRLLHTRDFCYANVPYRIKPFAELLTDPKSTVTYDEKLAARLEQRVADMGADGKLVLDAGGEVYQVNLLEKLLVPLLAKLGNLVIDGGIWMNTQRPEWNDANNALVGQGLSVVTLFYLRRYVSFLRQVLADESGDVTLSAEVSDWLGDTATALAGMRPSLGNGPLSRADRYGLLAELGEAACRYRDRVYGQQGYSGTTAHPVASLTALLGDALAAIDHTIASNRRDDGLYHAYNLLSLADGELGVDALYEMLEGQVAALSAGSLQPAEVIAVVEALFASDIYREDQHTFMLYPDREVTRFLARNCIPGDRIGTVPLLQKMLAAGDERIACRDADGEYRFQAGFRNVSDLERQLDALAEDYGDDIQAARGPLRSLFESVFNHQAFTGRSGAMFGFEGLGCVYWHMVSKLLLAVQENWFTAAEQDCPAEVVRRLGDLYYRIREGIGFNKTPAEYGAFPMDPYSHTPKHAGAQQPGMTGQVKEEILTRFGELGLRIADGVVHFRPGLLRPCEFTAETTAFRYLDVDSNWQEIEVPTPGLAFTWCQVPIVYRLDDRVPAGIVVHRKDGLQETVDGLSLTADQSREIFTRSGSIRRLDLAFAADRLFAPGASA